MVSNPAAEYRLKVARGFLAEASQNFAAQQWRACVEHCQLSVEHAAKAALALAGPVPRTHDPAATLLRALEQERFPEAARTVVEQLVEVAGQLGPDIHIAISYGDDLPPGPSNSQSGFSCPRDFAIRARSSVG